MSPILQIKNISKHFLGVKALDDVSFDVYPGEVHVLIGENGAGKSTLAKILLGAYHPNKGEVIVGNTPVKFNSPLEALNCGISGVYQELMLVPWLNIAQNIFLNLEPRIWKKIPFFIDRRKMHQKSKEILATLGLSVDTRQHIRNLGIASQQMVEIAKVLVSSPKVVIFDEPTAVLDKRETKKLFEHIRKLCDTGVAIIYISHRLQEIRQIGDKVTILRDGKKINTLSLDEVTDDKLVQMMIGRSIKQMYPRNRRKPGEEVLLIKGLDIKNGPKDVNFVVHKGEIVGFAGLAGAGRTEIAKAIFGIDRIEKGDIYLFGKKVTAKSPSQMSRFGVGLIPEDRRQYGIALEITVAWNIIMASLAKKSPRFFVDKKQIEKVGQKYIENLRIATPSVRSPVENLSGGNQQKVVLAKWLETKPQLVIFDEPTRGIDVGAKIEIHKLMDSMIQEGIAVIMISSDFAEILGMADRIYVMRQGRIVGHFNYKEISEEKIANLMLGVEKVQNAV